MAKLYFRYSAMNAGKTTQLLQVKHNYEERDQFVILLKPALDIREGTQLVKSRVGLESQATIINLDTNIYKLVENISSTLIISCILLDEAQFLTKEHVLQICKIVDDLNIPVIAYGLRSDFKGNLFPGSEALLAFSDSIEELKTICWCGKKAIMNTRISDGNAIYDGDQIFIGGNESYISLCRKHWTEGRVSP